MWKKESTNTYLKVVFFLPGTDSTDSSYFEEGSTEVRSSFDHTFVTENFPAQQEMQTCIVFKVLKGFYSMSFSL